jgi:hypothetical protein
MHADLQRKLIRMMKGKYNQIIIATHSVEIISEVRPHDILIVNRQKKESVFAESYPELQGNLDRLGSIHNIGLTRLLDNKKYLLVEGKDFSIIKILYDIAYPEARLPLDFIHTTPTGGWGSWDFVLENIRAIKKSMPKLDAIVVYDRDYFTEKTINKRIEEAKSNHIKIHIWRMKEIENYLIIPEAIARLICSKQAHLDYENVLAEIKKLIRTISDEMQQDTWDEFESVLCKENKQKEPKTIRKEFKPDFDRKWAAVETRLAILGGKEMLAKLSDCCKERFDVSFSDKQIASEIRPSEISKDFYSLFNLIDPRESDD